MQTILEQVRPAELLEAIPDAVVVVNDTARIIYLNTEAERMFGYTKAELVGRNIGILIPEEMQELHTEHVEDYLASPRVRPMAQDLDIMARHKDGRTFPVDIKLSPVEADDRFLVISSIREKKDISSVGES